MKRVVLLSLLMLGACGQTATLKPRPGALLPPAPAAARSVPTAEQLMTPDSQARPQRNDDLLQKSETRPADRFDLPPPG